MITGPQIRAARALLGWTAADLAQHAKLGSATVQRAETAAGIPTTQATNLYAIQQALEAGGAVFFDAGRTARRRAWGAPPAAGLHRYGSAMITGIQIAAARGLLKITFEELAKRSGVSVATCKRAEYAGSDVPHIGAHTLAKIEMALEQAGIAFVGAGQASPGGGVGVRLDPWVALERPR
jgi:transcriptional regulator with XRE-family HTH domain